MNYMSKKKMKIQVGMQRCKKFTTKKKISIEAHLVNQISNASCAVLYFASKTYNYNL